MRPASGEDDKHMKITGKEKHDRPAKRMNGHIMKKAVNINHNKQQIKYKNGILSEKKEFATNKPFSVCKSILI